MITMYIYIVYVYIYIYFIYIIWYNYIHAFLVCVELGCGSKKKRCLQADAFSFETEFIPSYVAVNRPLLIKGGYKKSFTFGLSPLPVTVEMKVWVGIPY